MKVYICAHKFNGMWVIQYGGVFRRVEKALEFADIPAETAPKHDAGGAKVWQAGEDKVIEQEIN